MKKIITTALGLSSMIALAQGNPNDYTGRVGINTTTPKASLEISKNPLETDEKRPQGVLFPSFSSAERIKFEQVTEGMMIYNTDKKCLEMYMGLVSGNPHWSCLPDANSPQAQKVSIQPLSLDGTYISGVALNSNNTVSFRLKNNGLTSIDNVDFSDAVSVTNGTAIIFVDGSANDGIDLQAGGTLDLIYELSGTPEPGQFTARFDKFGMTAERTTTVGLGSATINNKEQYVVSLVYNGTTVQGKINNGANKLSIKIPYVNGIGSYNAVNMTKTTAPGQGNDTNTLTLNIPAGTFSYTGELTADITVGGSDTEYLVKQLAPGQKEEIATFPIDMNGVQYTLKIVAIGGVIDKKFGQKTPGTNKYEHDFIYFPIQGPDGKTWLNNNLGAEYANIHSPYFNPSRQAGALDYTNLTTSAPELSNPTADQIKKDWRAYGYLYEWGRDSDGHEVIKWTSINQGAFANGGQNFDSRSTNNPKPGTIGDPCPDGYRTPRSYHLSNLQNILTGQHTLFTYLVYSTGFWNENVLKLPAAGRGADNTNLYDTGVVGQYWSDDYSFSVKNTGTDLEFWKNRSKVDYDSYRTNGQPIRCIADN